MQDEKLTKETFKFDAIFPHLNYVGVEKAIRSLRRNTPPENLGKVILINQSGIDYPWIKELVDICVVTKNLGFAKAVNTGIRLSDAEYVGAINDDCEFVNKRWVDPIIDVFNRYSTALCLNPSSPRNPRASGAEPIDHPNFPYKEEWTDEDYDRFVKEIGRGYVMDGICFWAPIFKRSVLEKVNGVIPGKCWLNEAYINGGGEDYHMNYAAYTTKNRDNDFGGYRCLGAGDSFVYHWWYSTKKPNTGEAGVKYDNTFNKLLGIWDGDVLVEAPDIFGRKGIKRVPPNVMRND